MHLFYDFIVFRIIVFDGSAGDFFYLFYLFFKADRRINLFAILRYYATEKELSERSKLYLTALREYNRREVLMKRLMRRKNIENIKMGEYLKILNEMLAAKTDEDMQRILRQIDKK